MSTNDAFIKIANVSKHFGPVVAVDNINIAISRGEFFYPPALSLQGLDLTHLLWLRPSTEEHCLWATQEVIRSGLFPLILTSHFTYPERSLRRFQLVTEESGSTVLHLSTVPRLAGAWALALRAQIDRLNHHTVMVTVLKTKKQLQHFQTKVFLYENTHSSHLLPHATRSRIAS